MDTGLGFKNNTSYTLLAVSRVDEAETNHKGQKTILRSSYSTTWLHEELKLPNSCFTSFSSSLY